MIRFHGCVSGVNSEDYILEDICFESVTCGFCIPDVNFSSRVSEWFCVRCRDVGCSLVRAADGASFF